MTSLLSKSSAFNASMFQENIVNRWKFLEEIDSSKSESVGFLIRSPYPLISLTIAYLLFVKLIGPRMMRSREPFELKNLIRFYNLLMVFLAGVVAYRLIDASESLGAWVDCQKAFTFADQSVTKIYQMADFLILVRLSEYLDTIFFTLRKKQGQVTFLHVFHHAFVPIYLYWALRTAPTRFNVFIVFINSIIHIFMYSYYYLATFQQPSNGAKSQFKQSPVMYIITKLLVFKKYMTQMQILQFITLGCYSIRMAVQPNRCAIPWTYVISNLLLAFGFLSLFLHFYMSTYKLPAAIKKRV